jgi:hypothetical protein
MGIVVLDGSEDWINNGAITYCIKATNYKDNLPKVLCDTLKVENVSQGSNNYKVISIHTEGIIRIRLTDSDTVDSIKQWLSQNPTTLVYELVEPYYEEITPTQKDLIITSVKEGDLHIDTIVPISSKVTYNVNVQLLADFEQSIVEQVQATQTTDLQSILDEEIDN